MARFDITEHVNNTSMYELVNYEDCAADIKVLFYINRMIY